MYLQIYEHQTPDYALEQNECKRRICVALLNDKKEFVDSFDYKQLTNEIRFYGESNHYNWNKIPKYKYNLWGTTDFQALLFNTKKF